jgi:DNA-binding NtrC family response regulator
MSQAHILVVDDEPDIRLLMQEILEDEGYSVELAENGEEARGRFAENPPDLVLLDIWMPDLDGISLLKEWSDSGRMNCPVVMISGHGTLETAVEATRLGATDFIEKPLSLAKLLATVKQALGSGSPAAKRDAGEPAVLPNPQGSSPQMQLLRQRAEQAAKHRTPVLISGEAGSGRSSLAAFIHRRSQAAGDWVVADASRLDGGSARDYLLGSTDRKGLLEQAAEGTLYLPQPQRIDTDTQALLAEVLDSGQFTPQGEQEPRSLRCRIIASVEEDGERLVETGELDRRLFLKLNVLPLAVPPLRERREDVPDLVGSYADWYSNHEGLSYRHFSISALNRLRNHDWPGNEQELRNLVQRLLVLGGEGDVTVQEVEDVLRLAEPLTTVAEGAYPASFDLPLREAREQFEREYLTYQLRKVEGSVGKLATAVGMERTHLYRKLRSLGIDPKSVASGGRA